MASQVEQALLRHLADRHLPAVRRHGGEELGQPFVQPHRKLRSRVPDDQMHVLVRHDVVRFLVEATHDDVVAVDARLIERSGTGVRTIRRELAVVGKDDQAGGRLRRRAQIQLLREERVNPFEVGERLTGGAGAGARVHLEVLARGVGPGLGRFDAGGEQQHDEDEGWSHGERDNSSAVGTANTVPLLFCAERRAGLGHGGRQ
jgi:hypothetical protein